MIMGEYDYSKNFVENPESTWAARILYVIFVVDISIGLMNLVLGLAVSDIEALQKNSAVQRMLHEAMIVIIFDNFFSIFRSCPILNRYATVPNSMHGNQSLVF